MKTSVLTGLVTASFVFTIAAVLLTLPKPEPEPLLDRLLADEFYQSSYSTQLKEPEGREQKSKLAEALIAAGSPSTYPHWRTVAPDDVYWNDIRSSADLFRASGRCDVTLHFSVYESAAWDSVYPWVSTLNDRFSASGTRVCFARDKQLEQPVCRMDQERVSCQFAIDEYPDRVHIVVGDEGIANTLNGHVYIAKDASASILLHELGHAFGLADEYPMRYELAQQFCSGQFRFSPENLWVTQSDLINEQQFEALKASLPWKDYLEQSIATVTTLGGQKYWRLGSDDPGKTGLFPASTCEGTPWQAWKPVAEMTFMEQHEIGSVPELYLNLIKARFTDQSDQRF